MEDARSRQFDERAIELDKPRFAPKDDGLDAARYTITPEESEAKRKKLVAALEAELRKLQSKKE